MAEELERTYVIPLRKVKNVKRTIRAPRAIREVQNFLMKHMKAEEVKRTIRAPRAIREIRNFLTKHMKAEEVKIDESINHAIWERGIQKIPSKITVKAVKDEDGVVKATLAE